MSHLQDEKQAFAEAWARNPIAPFTAACEIYPDNAQRALWVSIYWVKDEWVRSEMQRHQRQVAKHSAANHLSRDELLSGITERIRVCQDNDEYARLVRLYADICGYIQRPMSATSVQVTVPRAIEVPVHSSSDAWEGAAQAQQRELGTEAYSRH